MEHGIKMALSFQRGEQEGFEYFFNKLYAMLFGYGYKFIEDKDEVGDIVEHAFMKIWEKRDTFTHHLVIQDYLHVIVKNECLRRINKRKVIDKHESDLNKYEISRLSDLNADHTLIKSETKAIVHNWIKQLPAECGKIMKLMYVDGLTAREIAEHLDLEISTVKNQKAKGLEHIKAINEGKYKKKEIPPYTPKIESVHSAIPLELANIVFIEVPKNIDKKEKSSFIPWKNRKRGKPKEGTQWWSHNEKYTNIYEMFKGGASTSYLARVFELSESHINNIIVDERKSEKIKKLFVNGKRVQDIARITKISLRESVDRINYLFKINLNENENRTCLATYSSVFQDNQNIQREEGTGDTRSLKAQYG